MVAQKLVIRESLSAKIASGAVSAFQKVPSPLFVPKKKIDASGNKISGSIIDTRMPTLTGRKRSPPLICGIGDALLIPTPTDFSELDRARRALLLPYMLCPSRQS